MGKDEKVNILMVDDQPGKLLSYEVMLGGLGEKLIKAIPPRKLSKSCSRPTSQLC